MCSLLMAQVRSLLGELRPRSHMARPKNIYMYICDGLNLCVWKYDYCRWETYPAGEMDFKGKTSPLGVRLR